MNLRPMLVTAALFAIAALPAGAASPLAAIPIGQNVTYHLTSQTTTQAGPQSASHYVEFTRTAQTAFTVKVDGAPSGGITMGSGGVQMSPGLQQVMAPFSEIGTLLRNAPHPLTPGAGWSANLAIPVQGNTDNVAMSMSVTSVTNGRATIAGSGSNGTEVQPGVRELPADVSVNVSIVLTPAHGLASANSDITVAIHMNRRRVKSVGNSWTINPVR